MATSRTVPQVITSGYLLSKGAHPIDIDDMESVYPDGLDVTREALMQAADSGDIDLVSIGRVLLDREGFEEIISQISPILAEVGEELKQAVSTYFSSAREITDLAIETALREKSEYVPDYVVGDGLRDKISQIDLELDRQRDAANIKVNQAFTTLLCDKLDLP